MISKPHLLPSLALSLALASSGTAQSFSNNTTDIPTGGSANSSTTENVDFADVDSDGDLDAMFADGGDDGNDRNRLWINQGGLQGGTVGVFVDDTGPRLPVGNQTGRDIEFVDFDGDGDLDVYSSNTSTASNQTNQWWVNNGGLQGGTEGFYTDETATRWVNLGVNDGVTTFSSIPSSFVLSGGAGFIDFSCDCDFADLDNDGDQDLIHASYGGVFGGLTPTRLFLNDGLGNFEEYNPSGFVINGDVILQDDPALWAEGTMETNTTAVDGSKADVAGTTTDLSPADLDGDFDIDFILGGRNEPPRYFQNRLEENGGTLAPFRDRTNAVFPANWAPGMRHYEQELADLDDDGDLDLYGVNWEETMTSADDITMENDGTGVFINRTVVANSNAADVEADFIDYDQDGDLDVAIASDQSLARLHRNDGPAGSWSLIDVTLAELPAVMPVQLDVEAGDVDGDGDTDLFLARDNFATNIYLENDTNTADTTAPRVPLVEQAPDRASSATATVVRAHVYDNSAYYSVWYFPTQLEYSVDGGGFTSVDMVSSGAQVFRGEIPGTLTGTIAYRVRTTDTAGNVGLSGTLSYVAAACGGAVNYCTAGTSANGCQATLSTLGTPSATAATGFSLIASGVEGNKDGLYFFGANGRQANSWGNGTSFQCVVPPVARGGLLSGTGTNTLCDGAFSQDLNARWTAKPAQNPGAGALVQAQLWYRDPQNTSNQTTSLSDAVEFTVCP